MTTTTNPLDALLFVRDGHATSRWNFPAAVGTPVADPGGLGTGVSLGYSFLDAVPGYATTGYIEAITGFNTFDAHLRQATASALASIQEIIGVSFVPTSSGLGQITFGLSTQPPGQGGYAYGPGYGYSYSSATATISSVTENAAAGDVWLNANTHWIETDWLAGGSAYATLLHEMGHALGLKHPFEATANGFTLDSAFENTSHTVMSYHQAPQSTVVSVSGTPSGFSWQTSPVQPSTLMPMDIEALQYLYGANTSTRTGDDIYQWANHADLLHTIWDASGFDTIDCANQTLTCLIDLTPGSYSSIGLRQTDAELRLGLDLPSWFTEALPTDIYNGSNNLAIAKGVLIESAIGGTANDTITGNTLANTLAGLGGNDRLGGGDGFDTAVYSGPRADYVIAGEVDVFTVTGSEGTDTLTSIENLRFSDGDVLTSVGLGLGQVQQTLNILVYNWKTHALLDGVSVVATSHAAATDANGACSLDVAPSPNLALSAVRDLPAAQTAAADAAVNLQDAIAILKMLVGLDVNGAGKPLSPYQALAADFDSSGAVGLSDAIGVLKHVVGLSVQPPAWQFADETSGTVAAINAQTLTALPDAAISINTAHATSPIHVGLVGYLLGDVDASHAEAPSARYLDQLQPTYLADMTANHGLSLTQFGVYGV